jgi:hypothetical protein
MGTGGSASGGMNDTTGSIRKDNPGRALGHDKNNPGRAVGHDD